MKKKLLVFMLTAGVATAQLEIGKNYDFYQKNGQNVLGGRLEEESETEYQVRLKYMPKAIVLSKANLEKRPILSKIQESTQTLPKTTLSPGFIVNLTGGYSYLTLGSLNSIFKSGYQFGGGVDWLFLREPVLRIQSLSLAASYALYANSPRKIQLVSVHAGPKFLIWKIPAIDSAIFASALAGMSFANLTGYTFTASYATFSATGILHFEKRFKPVIVGLGVYANYLGDSGVTFVSTGVSLSVLYPLGEAQAF